MPQAKPEESNIVSGAANSLVEVIDRILDKGIVIDAWVAVSVIGIELITIEARVIVASVETYSKYAALLGYIGPIAGGLRKPTERKSLGEGIRDITQGIGQGVGELSEQARELPIVGNVGEKVGSVAQRGREKKATATQSKGGRRGRKSRKK